MPSGQPDILVVGGGIIGLTCARELQREGQRVAVLEGREPGSGASSAAAGLLSPLSEDHPREEFLHLCLEARNLWLEWAPVLEDDTGIAIGHDTSGALVPLLDEMDEEHLRRLADAARDAGEPFEMCPRASVLERVPDLSPRVQSTLLLPGEHRVDNVRVMTALVADLERLGVSIHRQRPIRRIDSARTGVVVSGPGWRTEARLAVIAAGAWSAQIEGLPRQPVRPVRGQMVSFDGLPWAWRGSIRVRDGYAVRRGSDGLLIGATVEDAGFDSSPTDAGRLQLQELVGRLFPTHSHRSPSSHWAGLRPGTADDLPILGWDPVHPVVWATGHYRNGILLAPWTARQVAAMVTAGRERGDPVAALSPGRFCT